jgi:uncharacterized RDD family membrane protein YckC
MPKAKPLYGKMVCKKCYYKFTNRRQFAYIIDTCLWQPASFIAGFPFGFLMVSLFPGIDEQQLWWSGLAFGYVFFLLFACKDGFSGHSIGKLITGVQVVDKTTYRPISFGTSLKRNLCLAIPFVVFVILVQMSHGQRLGDGWANSRVIWKKYKDSPVFTGAPLQESGETFLAGDGRTTDVDDNPFAAPRA